MTDLELAAELAIRLYGADTIVEVQTGEVSGWASALVRLPNGNLACEEIHRSEAVALAELIHRLSEQYRWVVRTRGHEIRAG